jgi:hypothetical protein
MTNHHWEFSIEALRREVNFETLVVVNDFTALARSLPQLSASRSIRWVVAWLLMARRWVWWVPVRASVFPA